GRGARSVVGKPRYPRPWAIRVTGPGWKQVNGVGGLRKTARRAGRAAVLEREGEGRGMPDNGLRRGVDHLPAATRAELTDGQLLWRFADQRDEDAFAALLRRHGRLVRGVCLRVLGHTQDAEDAFQGTFFVLARKAAALARCESVGGWLYAVATRA